MFFILLQLFYFFLLVFHKFLEPHRHLTLKIGSDFFFVYVDVTVRQNKFFVIKPTRCTNFTNLFCHETTCFG
jgi:hypothetical protein